MKLYINDAPMGECKSYKQIREATRPGWLFRMETGLNLFIRFDEISSFTSCGELRITEKPEEHKTNLYFEAFLGTLELFTVTKYGEIRTLNTYLDTPENRAALVSIYGATEVTKWERAAK